MLNIMWLPILVMPRSFPGLESPRLCRSDPRSWAAQPASKMIRGDMPLIEEMPALDAPKK
jgi:hypothetical protein